MAIWRYDFFLSLNNSLQEENPNNNELCKKKSSTLKTIIYICDMQDERSRQCREEYKLRHFLPTKQRTASGQMKNSSQNGDKQALQILIGKADVVAAEGDTAKR